MLGSYRLFLHIYIAYYFGFPLLAHLMKVKVSLYHNFLTFAVVVVVVMCEMLMLLLFTSVKYVLLSFRKFKCYGKIRQQTDVHTIFSENVKIHFHSSFFFVSHNIK